MNLTFQILYTIEQWKRNTHVHEYLKGIFS